MRSHLGERDSLVPALALLLVGCGPRLQPECPDTERPADTDLLEGPGLAWSCRRGRIAVTSVDFELVWDLRFNGGLVRWYDLVTDPERRENLCQHSRPGDYSQGSVFDYSTYRLADGHEYMHVLPGQDAEVLEIIEASPARVRIRQVAPMRDNSQPAVLWPEVVVDTEWTVYPTGRVAISSRASYATDEPLRLESYSIHMDGLYWTGFSDSVDGYGQACEQLVAETFLGVVGSGPRHHAGALLVHHGDFPHEAQGTCFDTQTWEDLGFLQWILAQGEYDPVAETYRYPPEDREESFVVQLSAPAATALPEPISERALARTWAEDYRLPPSIDVVRGSLLTDGGGDSDGDGFDEGTACVVVGWDEGVEVRLGVSRGGTVVPLHDPCVQIEGFPSTEAPEVQARPGDGEPLPTNTSVLPAEERVVVQVIGAAPTDLVVTATTSE